MNLKLKFDFKSIRFRLWVYFLTISVSILALTWFLQIFFLNNYYDRMKEKEVSILGQEIKTAYLENDENLTDKLQQYSILNDYYFSMEYNGLPLSFLPDNEMFRPVYTYQRQIPRLKQIIESDSERDSASFKFSAGRENYNTLAYATIIKKTELGNLYLFIFTPLYPVDSTLMILKNQFIYVSTGAMFLAFIMALLFSRRIARPVKEMTEGAKRLGMGYYNIRFNVKSYSEINKLAETLNTAAYEMEQADNRQKDLVANVSHDLKTPLTLIRSYAEMIRDLSGDDPEKRNSHLKVIMDETKNMANLVSDMATVCAMSMHKIVLDKELFDLTSLTAGVLASYGIYVEQYGYNFQLNAPKETMVSADKDRISQAIQNLTSNAIKYCGEDKTILVTIKKSGKKYRFEITDHGPGIKHDEIPHIWDRYYKASSNYVRATTGSGLGLSIVKEIFTLHHADFGVTSKEGQGSTFWFELEIAKN